MNPNKFKENIVLYGADLDKWPEEIRQAGIESLQNSAELQLLFTEEKEFEKILKSRKYEEPSSDLVQRILSLSLPQDKKSSSGLGLFLSRLFGDEFYLRKLGLIVASTLLIFTLGVGFVIGFSDSTGSALTDQRLNNLQEFLHYEGDVLWAKQ